MPNVHIGASIVVMVVARTNGRSVVVVGQLSTLKEAGICPSSRVP